VPDIRALLRGIATTTVQPELASFSALTGREDTVTINELSLLLRVPTDRLVAAHEIGADERELTSLAERGLLVSDLPRLTHLRERDEALGSAHWDALAAFFHFATRWRDVQPATLPAELTLDEAAAAAAADLGPAPTEFHAVAHPLMTIELPIGRTRGDLEGALDARKTTRRFDTSQSLSLHVMSAVLLDVFGCHGYAQLAPGVVGLHKTSPSGGGLHPIEAYPLVLRVNGVDPGLYHYRVEDHTLELLEPLTTDEAAATATGFTAGQAYFADAAVLFILTARFDRTFWKYRRYPKAYAVVLMDAAHLSQTLYLVCAAHGLGAFVTAAINDLNIEERLGLDGVREGAIAVCGFGFASTGRSPLEPDFRDYVPRTTTITR
jgi:putative peptide maturation dehydrogenase